jgi:hypothetical protein
MTDDDLDDADLCVLRYIAGCNDRGLGAQEPEMERIYNWARRVLDEAEMLRLVVKGYVGIDIEDDEPTFWATKEVRD